MALLPILEFPDPRLRTVAKPVETFDADLQKRIDDMFETMYAAPGVGLAATQIDWHRQLIVIDVSEEKDRPLVLINPRIVESVGAQTYQEGCLSVPGMRGLVPRYPVLRYEGFDQYGNAIDRTVDTHVKTLRAKLREVAPAADPIVTHRGLGYGLDDPTR